MRSGRARTCSSRSRSASPRRELHDVAAAVEDLGSRVPAADGRLQSALRPGDRSSETALRWRRAAQRRLSLRAGRDSRQRLAAGHGSRRRPHRRRGVPRHRSLRRARTTAFRCASSPNRWRRSAASRRPTTASSSPCGTRTAGSRTSRTRLAAIVPGRPSASKCSAAGARPSSKAGTRSRCGPATGGRRHAAERTRATPRGSRRSSKPAEAAAPGRSPGNTSTQQPGRRSRPWRACGPALPVTLEEPGLS